MLLKTFIQCKQVNAALVEQAYLVFSEAVRRKVPVEWPHDERTDSDASGKTVPSETKLEQKTQSVKQFAI